MYRLLIGCIRPCPCKGTGPNSKQLTLKQLATEVPNPVLARIAEVLTIATEKIELVKG
jgi:hypothetical protein